LIVADEPVEFAVLGRGPPHLANTVGARDIGYPQTIQLTEIIKRRAAIFRMPYIEAPDGLLAIAGLDAECDRDRPYRTADNDLFHQPGELHGARQLPDFLPDTFLWVPQSR